MKLLVTGSSGQIASYVVDAARDAGHDVVGLDLRPSRWTTLVGDVRSAETCRDAVAGRDAVIHCAARIDVQRSIEDPFTDASHNVMGTLALLNAAIASNVPRFVNVSSAAVYGRPVTLPIAENHPTLPLSPYGAGKLAAEQYARLAFELHGLDVTTVRPFNVSSQRQDPSNPYSGVLSRFVERAKAGEAPVIFGDGSATRDFIHATDVAGALLHLAMGGSSEDRGRAVNLGTGVEISIAELARRVGEAAGGPRPPLFEKARSGEIPRSVADVSFARRLGLRARVPLANGVAGMFAPK